MYDSTQNQWFPYNCMWRHTLFVVGNVTYKKLGLDFKNSNKNTKRKIQWELLEVATRTKISGVKIYNFVHLPSTFN